MLFVLAWSSVAFNLNEVYCPVMKTVFTFKNTEELPELDPPLESPALGWHEAHVQARRLMQKASAQHGIVIEHEEGLCLDRAHGVYRYTDKNSEDWNPSGGTAVVFDANTGALKSLHLPRLESSGEIVNRWLIWLHTARVLGFPLQILSL